MLSRDDIMTLRAAIRAFDLDHASLVALRKRLVGKELRHLGWQDDRGWFFRTEDIVRELEGLRIPSPPPSQRNGTAWPRRPTPRAPDGYVTMTQAMNILSLSRSQVNNLIKQGRIKALRQANGGPHPTIFINLASVYAEADRRAAAREGSDDGRS